jgi:hypothetical protein
MLCVLMYAVSQVYTPPLSVRCWSHTLVADRTWAPTVTSLEGVIYVNAVDLRYRAIGIDADAPDTRDNWHWFSELKFMGPALA